MGELSNRLLLYVENNWHKKQACLVLNIIVSIILLPLFYTYDVLYILSITTKEIAGKITMVEGVVALCLLLVTTVYWKVKSSPPRNVKGNIGIIVAISTENKNEKIRLKNDFIETLKNKINKGGKQNILNVIEYPEILSSQINMHNWRYYAGKSKSHFMIFGLLKKRFDLGKEYYVFKLDFAVIHSPIPESVSSKFAEVMKQVAPMDTRINVKNELRGFEITSEWAAFAIEYIIGVAAFLTGDLLFSAELHKKLYEELNQLKATKPAIKTLKVKNKAQLIECLFIISINKYYQYRKSGDTDLLSSVADILKYVQPIDQKNYAVNMLRAILYFLRDRDVDRALKELKKVPNKPNDDWRYSEAFLRAYKGDMDMAVKSYRKAFKGGVSLHIPDECGEFIQDIIKLEPSKYQLHFCLGLINFFAKEDLQLAKEDFEEFLKSGNSSEFREQRRLAEAYLTQIKI